METPHLIVWKDAYRRNRDMAILLGVGWYAVQAIEAYASAYFLRYDVSPDLSIRFAPTLINNYNNALGYYGNTPAVKLLVNF